MTHEESRPFRGVIFGTLIGVAFWLVFGLVAWAGSFTVTTTADQDAQLKALKVTPQQIVDQRLKGAAAADQNRKLAMLRQSCAKGDAAACTAIQTATKAVK